MKRVSGLLLLALSTVLILSGCGINHGKDDAEKKKAKGEMTQMDFSKEPENVIFLAGGCFWGIEQLMQSIPGVIDARSGYANGTCEARCRLQKGVLGRYGI